MRHQMDRFDAAALRQVVSDLRQAIAAAVEQDNLGAGKGRQKGFRRNDAGIDEHHFLALRSTTCQYRRWRGRSEVRYGLVDRRIGMGRSVDCHGGINRRTVKHQPWFKCQ